VNDHTKLTGIAVPVQRGLIPLAKHIPTTLLIQLYQTIQQNRMLGNRKGLLLLDIGFDDRRDCIRLDQLGGRECVRLHHACPPC
jgi:hypothetical protein